MTHLERRICLILLAVAFTGCGGRYRLEVTRGERDGFETVTVENSRIRVTFLPAVGGRLTEYTLKRTGANQFWVNPEFVPPENVTYYYPYGGLGDHLTLEGEDVYPHRLTHAPYTVNLTESADNVTVTLTYENPRWRLERRHVVFPDSTRLATVETVTNLDETPRELVPRPHPVFAVGGDGDNGDCLLQPVGTGLLVHRFAGRLGHDVPVPAAGWAAAVDPDKNQAVVLTFDNDVEEVNLWFSEDSYNMEPMRGARRLAKGESLSMAFDMFILSDKDLAKEARTLPVEGETAERIAGALETLLTRRKQLAALEENGFYLARWGVFRPELPKVLTCDAEPLPLAASVVCFDADAPSVDVKFSFIRKSDGKAMPTPRHVRIESLPHLFAEKPVRVIEEGVDVGPPEAFSVKNFRATFEVLVEGLGDGVYELVLEVGPEGSRERVTQDLVVAAGLRRQIEASKQDDKERLKPTYAAARFYLESAERTGAGVQGNVPAPPSVYAALDELLARSREYLAGKVVEPNTGVFARFYTSDIDDSVQGYHVHLPDGYTRERTWPMVMHLHGAGSGSRPFDPEGRDPRFDALVKHSGAVLVRPHGRGRTGYRGPGADDVFTVIDIVRKDFNIDPDRIYLTGNSMGGGGVWSLATRYPDVFAAVAPLFGFGTRWTRAGAREEVPAWRHFSLDAASPVTLLENLRHTPVYIYHGLGDATIDVEQSRLMARRLEELGCDYTYEEDPSGVHIIPNGLFERVWDFFAQYRLPQAPKTVTHESPFLRWGESHWVRMDAFAESMKFGGMEATLDGQSIDVTPQNVTAFTLHLAKSPLDPSKEVTVVIGGESAFVIERPRRSGEISFHLGADPKVAKPVWRLGAAAKSKPGALVKTAQTEGPMEDVFRSRFIVVCGTLGDDETDEICRAQAEAFSRERWRRIQHVDCIIKPDGEVTAEDKKEANLVLIGGPDVNIITREIASGLPVTFAKDGVITIDGKKLAAPDGAVALVYPNPQNLKRYVLLFAGTSPGALKDIIRRTNLEFDYHAFDGKSEDTASAVLFGVFDRKWRFDKKTQWGRDDTGESGEDSE